MWRRADSRPRAAASSRGLPRRSDRFFAASGLRRAAVEQLVHGFLNFLLADLRRPVGLREPARRESPVDGGLDPPQRDGAVRRAHVLESERLVGGEARGAVVVDLRLDAGTTY